MNNDDLKNIKALSESKIDTDWLKVEHGVVCGLDNIIVLAMTREQFDSLATELLDSRARIERVGP